MEKTPAWKAAEHLVSWLEGYISPDARIEHDVELPVIGQGRTRQCDVVIRMGRAPREQIWIVEVQNRRSRPEIGTFHGWVHKMNEVGAHGLICVSHQGFPDSIIQDVNHRLGPRVKLLTINAEGHPDYSWSSKVNLGDPEIAMVNFHVTIDELVTPLCPGPCMPRLYAGPCMPDSRAELSQPPQVSNSNDIQDAIPIGEFIQRMLHKHDPFLKLPPEAMAIPLEIEVNLIPFLGKQLWVHFETWSLPFLEWEIRMCVTRSVQRKRLAHTRWSYTQQTHEGAAAWFAKASGELEGVQVEFTVVLVPEENDLVGVGTVVEMKSDRDVEFCLTWKSDV